MNDTTSNGAERHVAFCPVAVIRRGVDRPGTMSGTMVSALPIRLSEPVSAGLSRSMAPSVAAMEHTDFVSFQGMVIRRLAARPNTSSGSADRSGSLTPVTNRYLSSIDRSGASPDPAGMLQGEGKICYNDRARNGEGVSDVKKLMSVMLTWALAAAAVICAGGAWAEPAVESGHRDILQITCTDDYAAIYASELDEIFGDHTIEPGEPGHIEGEDCACGYHHDTVDYLTWIITYTDSAGQVMTCTLDNYNSFWDQQMTWFRDQIEARLATVGGQAFTALDREKTRAYCTIGNILLGYQLGTEEEEYYETGRAWLEDLIAQQKPIPLHALRYDEVFSQYPVEVSLTFRFSDYDTYTGTWDEYRAEKTAQMDDAIRNILEETGCSANLEIRIWFKETVYDAEDRLARFFIAGEETDFWEDDMRYSVRVYLSYLGRFW